MVHVLGANSLHPPHTPTPPCTPAVPLSTPSGGESTVSAPRHFVTSILPPRWVSATFSVTRGVLTSSNAPCHTVWGCVSLGVMQMWSTQKSSPGKALTRLQPTTPECFFCVWLLLALWPPCPVSCQSNLTHIKSHSLLIYHGETAPHIVSFLSLSSEFLIVFYLQVQHAVLKMGTNYGFVVGFNSTLFVP